jgi:hypothetical protein
LDFVARSNKDKLKMDVFIEVSKVVNTHRIAEANELITQNHIYKRRVSDLQQTAVAQMPVVLFLKLLAGELLKHAMFPTPSYQSQSFKFQNNAELPRVKDVARKLSMSAQDFTELADRCADTRNEAAHFVLNENWRKNCSKALLLVKQCPNLETVCKDQVFIIRAYRKICKNVGWQRR